MSTIIDFCVRYLYACERCGYRTNTIIRFATTGRRVCCGCYDALFDRRVMRAVDDGRRPGKVKGC